MESIRRRLEHLPSAQMLLMTVRLRVLVFGAAHHQRILDGWRNIPVTLIHPADEYSEECFAPYPEDSGMRS